MTPVSFIVVCPLVFLAGFIDAAAGGGGLISLPAYLLAGLPPHLASGTNKASAMCGTTAALLRYQKSGKIDWTAALPTSLLAIPGALLGTRLQLMVSPDVIRLIMAICIPLLAVFLLGNRKSPKEREMPLSKTAKIIMGASVGFVIGIYDGFLGPGTGTFLILAFTLFYGMDMVTASGSAKVVNLLTNISSFAIFAFNGNVLYPLALPAALCSVAGGTLGARFAIQKGRRLIRVIIWIVLALMAVRLAYDVYLSGIKVA